MESINFGDAADRFGELIEKAEAGETITITRDGEPVVALVPTPKTADAAQVAKPRKRIDVDALRAFTAGMPFQEESAGEFMRKLRESDRY